MESQGLRFVRSTRFAQGIEEKNEENCWYVKCDCEDLDLRAISTTSLLCGSCGVQCHEHVLYGVIIEETQKAST